MNYKSSREIPLDEIIKFCTEKNDLEWLKEKANEKVTNKNGVLTSKSLFTLKSEFVNRYEEYAYLRAKSPKKKSWIDRINAL